MCFLYIHQIVLHSVKLYEIMFFFEKGSVYNCIYVMLTQIGFRLHLLRDSFLRAALAECFGFEV